MQELPTLSGCFQYQVFFQNLSDPSRKEQRFHKHLKRKFYRYIRKPYLKRK